MSKNIHQTILVMGASGFIGRHAIRKVVALGHSVYATCLPGESPSPLSGVTWLPCDLNSPDFAATMPVRCDSIIYLAQSLHWRQITKGAMDMLSVNVAAALRVAEYAQKAGARRFVFASSGSVYSQTTQAARENDFLDLNAPRNFYIASKLATELLLKPYAELFNVIILRLFVPYGAGQHPEMLIPQLIARVQKNQPVDLHGKDGLSANPVYVNDVAETIQKCLALDSSATLNVGGPETLSLREISACIGRVLELEPRFTEYPDQSAPVIAGDTTFMKSILGWSPHIRFEDGLRQWLKS